MALEMEIVDENLDPAMEIINEQIFITAMTGELPTVDFIYKNLIFGSCEVCEICGTKHKVTENRCVGCHQCLCEQCVCCGICCECVFQNVAGFRETCPDTIEKQQAALLDIQWVRRAKQLDTLWTAAEAKHEDERRAGGNAMQAANGPRSYSSMTR